jgi:hypothetical protein
MASAFRANGRFWQIFARQRFAILAFLLVNAMASPLLNWNPFKDGWVDVSINEKDRSNH